MVRASWKELYSKKKERFDEIDSLPTKETLRVYQSTGPEQMKATKSAGSLNKSWLPKKATDCVWFNSKVCKCLEEVT